MFEMPRKFTAAEFENLKRIMEPFDELPLRWLKDLTAMQYTIYHMPETCYHAKLVYGRAQELFEDAGKYHLYFNPMAEAVGVDPLYPFEKSIPITMLAATFGDKEQFFVCTNVGGTEKIICLESGKDIFPELQRLEESVLIQKYVE